MAKVAIVGTGISGLGSAFLLNPEHEITVYEKAARIGGHSRTVTLDYDGRAIPVDTGFIVFNRPNYPNLSGLFAHLGVPTHASDMTFATSIRDGWLEWGLKDLDSVIGQRRNLLRPRFGMLVRDVLKFNAQAQETVERHPELNVEGLIAKLGLGDWFRRFYLLPMSGAIWSCPPSEMMNFPARTLVQFFANHHLMSFTGQPQWRTVTGGSQEYVRRLTGAFAHRIRTNCGAVAVTREDGKVQIKDTQGGTEVYDQVVMASHGDETLALLKDTDRDEQAALSCFRYQKNIAVLHRDESTMPHRRKCWASWNYVSDGDILHPKVTVTYWMNLLQGIDQKYPLFVSLNPKREIPDHLVFDRTEFDHPVFDEAAIAAQGRIAALQGRRGTWFAGAHLGHGFHEDGLASAVRVARGMGADIPWEAGALAAPDAPQQKARQPVMRPGFPAQDPVPAELF
ncbi:MAG: FAD-dependent oxidoreductase [Alphaproteobacteria bacterium]|nr:FAD-dependent oxidoreductase [Alphaproteobacteria bacterium]